MLEQLRQPDKVQALWSRARVCLEAPPSRQSVKEMPMRTKIIPLLATTMIVAAPAATDASAQWRGPGWGWRGAGFPTAARVGPLPPAHASAAVRSVSHDGSQPSEQGGRRPTPQGAPGEPSGPPSTELQSGGLQPAPAARVMPLPAGGPPAPDSDPTEARPGTRGVPIHSSPQRSSMPGAVETSPPAGPSTPATPPASGPSGPGGATAPGAGLPSLPPPQAFE